MEIAFAPVTLQSAAAATGNGVVLACNNYETIAVQVNGTFVGTVSFEGSIDGVNFYAVPFINSAGTNATTATATGIFLSAADGYSSFRARVSAYTSGSITVIAGGKG